MVRRTLSVVALLCIVVGATAAFIARPWHHGAGSEELTVEQATLRPGAIALQLVNGSGETARVAQVIVNDAYVDFDAARRSLAPGSSGTVSVAYPWIEGESYEIEVLFEKGNALMYEIEDAAAGVVAGAA